MITVEANQDEQIMRQAYTQQADQIVANLDRYQRFGPKRLGLEVEYSIIQTGQDGCLQSARDWVVEAHHWLSPELGVAQIELHTDPKPYADRGLAETLEQLQQREYLMRTTARAEDLQIVRYGTNPWLALEQVATTNKIKYRQVPEYYDQRRTSLPLTLDPEELVSIKSLSIVSVLNAFQINLEADNATDAIDLLNRSLMVSPIMTALAGNARYLAGQDTQISDLRMLAWSNAVDTRKSYQQLDRRETRVGLPDSYYSSIPNYLSEVGKYPFILYAPEDALAVGIGMNWRDARLKFIADSLVVEFRSLSTQPTPEQDFACALMYLGRTTWSQVYQEPLLPIELVKLNKHQAMLEGINARIWAQDSQGLIKQQTVRELGPQEIAKAKQGLEIMGIDPPTSDYLDLLIERIDHGNPSDQLHRSVHQLKSQGLNPAQSLRQLLAS